MFTSLKNLKQLRWVMVLFFIAIAIPAFVLSFYSYSQLKWEAFYLQRNNATELTQRINDNIQDWIVAEEGRSFTDYRFLRVAGDETSNYFTPSPLSVFPPVVELPGVIGFFQVDSRGILTSPVLPDSVEQGASYGVTADDFNSRRKLFNEINHVLLDNKLIAQKIIEEPVPVLSENETSIGLSTAIVASAPISPAEAEKSANTSLSKGNENKRRRESFEALIKNKDNQSDDKNVRKRYQQVEDLEIETNLEEALVSDAKNKKSDSANADLITAKQSVTSKKEMLKTAPEENTDFSQAIKSKTTTSRSPRIEKSFELADSSGQTLNQATDQMVVQAPSSLSSPVPSSRRIINDVPADLADRAEASADEIEARTASTIQKNIAMFESEIDPFEFSLLSSGHLVMFRKVWRDGQRYIQGILLNPDVFLQQAIEESFRRTSLSDQTDLVVAYEGNVLSLFSGNSARYSNLSSLISKEPAADTKDPYRLSGERLLQANLITPFNNIELIFSVKELERGPGAKVIVWSSLLIGLVLSVGTWLMYLLGVRQLRLAQQQQDFVSAVSHELKTPLTSIRMYGELLKEGWATEEKKTEYYSYIFDESERLTRLINNVLQLAKMNRGDWNVQLKEVAVSEFADNVRSKLMEQVKRSGFYLNLHVDKDVKNTVMLVDIDFLLQIVINLVDNAIKFSHKSDNKNIDVTFDKSQDSVVITVRDYGPGVAKGQLKKIFGLFYRGENELTRETVGTGIGLALVNQLANAMSGTVSVSNEDPGAAFKILVPVA